MHRPASARTQNRENVDTVHGDPPSLPYCPLRPIVTQMATNKTARCACQPYRLFTEAKGSPPPPASWSVFVALSSSVISTSHFQVGARLLSGERRERVVCAAGAAFSSMSWLGLESMG